MRRDAIHVLPAPAPPATLRGEVAAPDAVWGAGDGDFLPQDAQQLRAEAGPRYRINS